MISEEQLQLVLENGEIQFETLKSDIIPGLSKIDLGPAPGPVFTNHSQENSLSLSPRFAIWNVTRILIG